MAFTCRRTSLNLFLLSFGRGTVEDVKHRGVIGEVEPAGEAGEGREQTVADFDVEDFQGTAAPVNVVAAPDGVGVETGEAVAKSRIRSMARCEVGGTVAAEGPSAGAAKGIRADGGPAGEVIDGTAPVPLVGRHPAGVDERGAMVLAEECRDVFGGLQGVVLPTQENDVVGEEGRADHLFRVFQHGSTIPQLAQTLG
jgi:hypothetical protein